jgi:hypothetical protein
VVGRVGVDPRAVAEQRPAAAPRRGVDGQNGDRPPARPPLARERGQERRLPGPRRARDADEVAGRLAAERGRPERREQRGARLPRRRRAGLEQVAGGRRRGEVASAEPVGEAQVTGGARDPVAPRGGPA